MDAGPPRAPEMMRALALAAVLILPSALAAQPPRLEPGLRVRIEAPSVLKKRLAGTLMAQGPESLSVTDGPVSYNVPTAAVRRIDVSSGTSHLGGAVRGAAYGGAVLGVVGIGFAIGNTWEGQTFSNKLNIVFGTGMFGAMIGGAVGLLMGVEKWTRVFP